MFTAKWLFNCVLDRFPTALQRRPASLQGAAATQAA
jgi:hypothetical protein